MNLIFSLGILIETYSCKVSIGQCYRNTESLSVTVVCAMESYPSVYRDCIHCDYVCVCGYVYVVYADVCVHVCVHVVSQMDAH